MKLRNKILFILICIIVLFLICANKGYCASGDFDNLPTSYVVDNLTFDISNAISLLSSTDYDNYDYHFVYGSLGSNSNYIHLRIISGDLSVLGSYDTDSNGNDVIVFSYGAKLLYQFNITLDGSISGFESTNLNGTYRNSNIRVPTWIAFYSNVPILDSSGEVVFRAAGGSSGSSELSNPYGEYNYSSDDTSGGEYVDSDFEDTSDGGWLSKLTNWLKAPFQKLAQLLAKIFNFFVNFIQRILAGFFDFFVTVFVPNTNDIIFDEVKETILSKFPFINSFNQIQIDFQNAFDNESGCPTFNISIPQFLGGGQVSPIDFRFYNQYRSWISGFIVSSSYFLFIRKMYYKIPKLVKGE